MHYFRALLLTFVAWRLAISTLAQDRGVIDDPDGYVNVRARPSLDAATIATVKRGEVFSFEAEPGKEWCKVKLANGKSGWMHQSRVRFHYELNDIPAKGESGDELTMYGKSRGVNYYGIARAAARGDARAMKQFFGMTDVDGAAAESHFSSILPAVLHLAGDEKMTAFLQAQPINYQSGVRGQLSEAFYPFTWKEYLRLHFPKTTALLFRGDVVGWKSPDGRYSIRKQFSHPSDLEASRVTLANVIENATLKVVGEMTDDDEGVGATREGNIIWAPDSKRFASYSSKQNSGHTTVYSWTGEYFAAVKLPIDNLPGRDGDLELEGAKHIHTFVEPIRWKDATTLMLDRRDYFEKTEKPGGIHGIGRFYHLKIAMDDNGKATLKSVVEEK